MPHLFLILFFCAMPPDSQSSEEIRALFEWGEYPELIRKLEPLVRPIPVKIDSLTIATYFSYLGVAYYGVGRIEDSRNAFLKAFSFDTLVTLDSNYITHEIALLCSMANNECLNQRIQARQSDSLLQITQKAFNNSINEVRLEAKKKRSRSSLTLAVSFFSVSAIFGGLMVYEYNTTKDSYNDFQIASRQGDKINYDKNRNIVNRANTLIATCGIAAGTSVACGILFSLNITGRKAM
jgi:tetratricopeptide (TPR) repeat protein